MYNRSGERAVACDPAEFGARLVDQETLRSPPMSTLVEPNMSKNAAGILLLIACASLIAGFLGDRLFGHFVSLRPSRIQQLLDGFGPWAPVVFIAAMACAVIITPIPSVPLDIAAGLAFGLVWGTAYTLVGAELGALVAFVIARKLGRPLLVRWLPAAAMARIDELAARRGVRALLLMRLWPVFNFDWVSYAAGTTAISPTAFALATLVGMTPPVIAIVAVGATLPDRPVLAGVIFVVLVFGTVIPLAWPWIAAPKRGRTEA